MKIDLNEEVFESKFGKADEHPNMSPVEAFAHLCIVVEKRLTTIYNRLDQLESVDPKIIENFKKVCSENPIDISRPCD